MFYDHRGALYDAYSGHPGVGSLCMLLAHQEDKHDLWLVYELCGQPLNKVLYKTKGQFFNGERIYEVS
jgi:hypothetical protein